MGSSCSSRPGGSKARVADGSAQRYKPTLGFVCIPAPHARLGDARRCWSPSRTSHRATSHAQPPAATTPAASHPPATSPHQPHQPHTTSHTSHATTPPPPPATPATAGAAGGWRGWSGTWLVWLVWGRGWCVAGVWLAGVAGMIPHTYRYRPNTPITTMIIRAKQATQKIMCIISIIGGSFLHSRASRNTSFSCPKKRVSAPRENPAPGVV